MKIFMLFQDRSLKVRAMEAERVLESAWTYLWKEFWSHASTKDRDCLIAPQREALDLLNTAQHEAIFALIEAQ